MKNIPISVARGDGIGPEIMDSVIRILNAAQARIDIEYVNIGQDVYATGNSTGIEDAAIESINRTHVLLKSPFTTPQGGGYKSVNVTLRKLYGLTSNVRPVSSMAPFIPSKSQHPMDLVVVRENGEDLYTGVEYRPTADTTIAHKTITREGSENIARYAFEYARAHGRKKVTCMAKDNILKMTDGMFRAAFDKIGAEYPDIEKDYYIIDIGSARLATRPEQFDVIVTENLYGDVLSDITAEVATGSVGFGGSADIGDDYAMFEAIHGSAPDIAGKGIANPTGLLLASVMMLVHIGQNDVAEKIHNAWLKTIEDGIHTGDIRSEKTNEKVNTEGFEKAVIARLGQKPEMLKPVSYPDKEPTMNNIVTPTEISSASQKETIGVDVYIDAHTTPNELAATTQYLSDTLNLKDISNLGTSVWPADSQTPPISLIDHWRLRYIGAGNSPTSQGEILDLLQNFNKAGLQITGTETLFTYDGNPGFTSSQGEKNAMVLK